MSESADQANVGSNNLASSKSSNVLDPRKNEKKKRLSAGGGNKNVSATVEDSSTSMNSALLYAEEHVGDILQEPISASRSQGLAFKDENNSGLISRSSTHGSKPGAVAVAGIGAETDLELSQNSPAVEDQGGNDEQEQVRDLESNSDEIEPSPTIPVLIASVVDEDLERQRLRQAEEYGRQQVLKDVVVAEALPMPENPDEARSENKYSRFATRLADALEDAEESRSRNKCSRFAGLVAEVLPKREDSDEASHRSKCVCCAGILAIIIAAAVLVASITATRSNRSSNLIVAPTLSPIFADGSPEAPTEIPTQYSPSAMPTQLPLNENCSTAYIVEMDGSTIHGTFFGRDPDLPNAFEPCTNGFMLSYALTSWYLLRGNGLAATARLCGINSLLVMAGDCNREPHQVMPDYTNCISTGVDSSSYLDGCTSMSWLTQVDTNYYLLVATASDDSGNYASEIDNGNYTLALDSNDVCDFAYMAEADGTTYIGSTVGASSDNITDCGSLVHETFSTPNGVWFAINGTGTALTFDTCKSSSFSANLVVYSGNCSSLQCIAVPTFNSNFDTSCQHQSSVTWLSVAGELYYLFLHGGSGPFVLSGSQSPRNSFCQGADKLSIKASSMYNGSTVDSGFLGFTSNIQVARLLPTSDEVDFSTGTSAMLSDASSCDWLVPNYGPGVWYEVAGVENATVSIDACSSAPVFRPNLLVLQGPCDALLCVNASYSNACGSSGSYTSVSWKIADNGTYLLFVYGGSETETGGFLLNITVRSPAA